ncbi:MAG: hypothetical protein EOO63_08315, partial [Hymenobacter sp.]
MASCLTGCTVHEGALGLPIRPAQLLNNPREYWQDTDPTNAIMPGISIHPDSTLTGVSKVDTVFYFTYRLQGRYLVMHDGFGRVEKCRIL